MKRWCVVLIAVIGVNFLFCAGCHLERRDAIADAVAPVGPPEPHAEVIIRRILAEVMKIRTQDPLAVPMAFWDFDGTIICGDSGFGLAKNGRILYHGLIEEMIKGGLNSVYRDAEDFKRWYRDYQYMASLGPWLAQAFDAQMYVGVKAEKIDALCREVIRDQGFSSWYFSSSMAIWKALAEAGVDNCIVSANADPLVRNLAPTLGIPPEKIRGVRVASENGCWTTKVLYPLPYGEGKAETVREMVQARQHGVAVAAFGNNYRTDKYFLRYVATQSSLPGGAKGTAVMINGGSAQSGFTEHFICVRQENVVGGKGAHQ